MKNFFLVKFACPGCRKEIEGTAADEGTMLICPKCKKVFAAQAIKVAKRVEPPAPEPAPLPPWPKPEPLTEKQRLRQTGTAIQVIAALALVGGLVCILIGVALGHEQTALPIIGAGLLMAALWLLILAQLYFIRSNGEH